MADAWWDDIGLAWEINSSAWHLSPEDYAREQRKHARFAAAGITLVPTLAKRLREDRTAVVTELRSAHAAAHGRRRPPGLNARPLAPGEVPPSHWGGFTATGRQ